MVSYDLNIMQRTRTCLLASGTKDVIKINFIFPALKEGTMELLYKPWPWYVAGVIIGLAVPALLLAGNRRLGISSTLRQICAACVPAGIPFLQYDWKKDGWNLFFVAGILIGGYIGGGVFKNEEAVTLSPQTVGWLSSQGVAFDKELIPLELFNWRSLATLRGFVL